MNRALVAIPLLLLLCGCPPTPVTLKTVTLAPSQLDSPYEYWNTSGPCLGSYGDGDWNQAGPFEVVSGFQDVFQSFSFGCTAQEEQLYRGHVAFDLGEFDQVVGATLLYSVDSSLSASVAPDGGVVQDNPAQSYATVLGMSTGTKNSGNGDYYWDFDNPVSLPACTSASFTGCSLDVTPQAKTWVAAALLNNGFIIAGPNLDFPNDNPPHDNAGTLTNYGGFKLQVLYNPALNPRAPQ